MIKIIPYATYSAHHDKNEKKKKLNVIDFLLDCGYFMLNVAKNIAK
jgi:predicted Ser/Thr protein kinase